MNSEVSSEVSAAVVDARDRYAVSAVAHLEGDDGMLRNVAAAALGHRGGALADLTGGLQPVKDSTSHATRICTPDGCCTPTVEGLSTDSDIFDFAQTLIGSRQNVSPKRLVEPGPTEEQLEALLTLAAAAPDHGRLTPWRFIVVPMAQRDRLADAFALALIDRDASATAQQIASAREKAYRAPLLMLAVACLGPREPNTPALERMISMGAAIQNLLLGAHAMGFGAGLTSGQAMSSERLRVLFGLVEGESAVCCVNLGKVSKRQATQHVRPSPATFVSELSVPPLDP